MKKIPIILPIFALLCLTSCSITLNDQTQGNESSDNRTTRQSEADRENDDQKEIAGQINKPSFSPPDAGEEKPAESKTAPPTNSCNDLKRAGMKLDKKQTFPINFAPFKGGCFATFHEPDFDDPPLGEKFYIYRDGREVFAFPDPNQAATYTVEAVAFEDLNGDNLTDVIVVGSAGAKSGKVYSNQVFTNTSQDFYTDRDANLELDDFTKISEIKNFVKKNPKIFFP